MSRYGLRPPALRQLLSMTSYQKPNIGEFRDFEERNTSTEHFLKVGLKHSIWKV